MKELENASARVHINRLEALKIRTQHAAEVAFGNELDNLDSMARKVFTEDYYHTIYEIQKSFNMGWEIGQIDDRKLDTLITKPWAADGKNFSERIWGQRSQLVSELHNQLTRTCILGKAPDDAIKAISKKFGTTKSQAGRLVMTEQAYFHSVAQQKAFEDLDVEEYEIVATLDSHTSEICQELDGKHFPMKDYQPGVTAPPFHVWCRSVTVPWFEDNYTGERAARDEDGNTYYVPDSMTYKEWSKEYIADANHSERNMSDDKEQYERYKNVLKENSPDSFKKFKEIKYSNSDEWQTLKHQYRTINRYDVDGNVPTDTILNLDQAAWYTKQTAFPSDDIKDKYLKKQIKKLSKEGNASTMLFDGDIYFSHSRFGADGTSELMAYHGEYPVVGLQNNRKFTTKPINKDDVVLREYDTEAKFLEFVATQKKPDDVFTITILSEKHICTSCQGVVEQFNKMYPNSTVNIVSGKLGYNNSDDGLKTWKYRKKVKKQ
jgi:SPP1 gp7 family putative phage head morphogenesis protein